MKPVRLMIAAVVIMLSMITQTAFADEARSIDEAIDTACTKIAEEIKTRNFEDIKNVAVLPLWGKDEDGYISNVLKSRIAGGTMSVMVRSDQEWDNLLGEIKWNTLREDVMNQSTIQGFGKIKGCDAILYGTVRERVADSWTLKAYVRMTVFLADVETGEIVWSSGPVTATQMLGGAEVFNMILHHPVAWIIAGVIVVLILWKVFVGSIAKAMRPR